MMMMIRIVRIVWILNQGRLASALYLKPCLTVASFLTHVLSHYLPSFSCHASSLLPSLRTPFTASLALMDLYPLNSPLTLLA